VASTFLLSFVGFMILWRICRPRNHYRNEVIGLYIMLAAVFAIEQESLMRNITEFFGNKFEEARYVD